MELRDSRVYYGTCSTEAGVQTKEINIKNPVFNEQEGLQYLDLQIGDKLIVNFLEGNTESDFNLLLTINDFGQNITTSNDTNTNKVIIGTNDDYQWSAATLVEFVYVWKSVSGTTEDNTETVSWEKQWKLNMHKIADADFSGIVKIANQISEIDNSNSSMAPTCRLTSTLIENAINNMGITISKNNDTGIRTITLKTNNNNKAVEIPKIPTKTNELSNTGWMGEEGEHYFNNIYNVAFIKDGLGIGRRYLDSDGEQQTLVNFYPYNLNSDKTINYCLVGYGGLKHYQAGTVDRTNKKISINPYTNMYGKQIRLWFDASEEVGIGTINIPKDEHNLLYWFNKDKAHFNNDLYVKGSGHYIHCNGIRLPHPSKSNEEITMGQFVDDKLHYAIKWGSYKTTKESLKFPAGSATASNSKPYTLKKEGTSAHLAFELKDIPEGYVPIAIGGFNLDQDRTEDTPSKMLLWECYILEDSGKYYVRYALRNLKDTENRVWFSVRVIYRKKELF